MGFVNAKPQQVAVFIGVDGGVSGAILKEFSFMQNHGSIECAWGFDCLNGRNIPQWFFMNEAIQWPGGDFTIQQALELNPAIPQAVVRAKLADAIAAKSITRTKKGDGKTKGTFQVVAAGAAAK